MAFVKGNESSVEAAHELQELCDSYSQDEDCLLHVWDADDWLYDSRDELGITDTTTDEELGQIAKQLRKEAADDGINILRNLDAYLVHLRDEAKKAAEEEEEEGN